MDIHIAKAAVQNTSPSYRDSLFEMYFLQSCEIHGVSPDKVRADLDILTSDPDQMELIYQVVIDSLEKMTLLYKPVD